MEYNLDQLCEIMRCDESSNCGGLFDEQKRADSIFLRQMVREFKNDELKNHRYLRQRLYDADTAHIHSPNEITTRNISDATAELEIFVEEQNARRQHVKFGFDVRCGETGGKTFFQTPYSSDMRVTIPNVKLDDGTLSANPETLTSTHRKYWGDIFQSPSWDLKPTLPKRHFNQSSTHPILSGCSQAVFFASGLTLNSDKNIILPFQACDPHLRDSLANDGLEVVANEGHTKLLGILQSPTRHHSTRFDSLLPQMVERCQLWKYRGQTLCGRAVLLRSVILPLL
ncbi:hypothetical protein PsorP6_010315 [Peronosclerospora sorghi]|uniref:Uncharacterized protein n=1 Tax=Peronosclerospora sorghi TaxID=230839 RepID=A0ACC0VW70_9STRA|nr:hypothetical protein PsorP6_010315 [Peronosclerospora sorghi]